MALKRATWTDEDGRKWRTLLPAGAPEEDAEDGIPDGPPRIELPGWPDELAIRLQNELVARGLCSLGEIRGRRRELDTAIKSAIGLDVEALMGIFVNQEVLNHGQAGSTEDVTDPGVSPRRRRRARN